MVKRKRRITIGKFPLVGEKEKIVKYRGYKIHEINPSRTFVYKDDETVWETAGIKKAKKWIANKRKLGLI